MPPVAPVTADSPAGPGGLPRAFWALWSATFVSRIASFAQPFLALYLTKGHGVSPATAGTIVSGMGAGSVVSTIVGGWAADRFGRRATMLTGQAVAAGALLWLATAQSLWQLGMSAVLVGFGGDLARPAVNATASDLVPHRLQVRAFALMFWALNLAFVVATVSAGLLTRWGYPTLFVLEAAASVVAGLIVLRGVPETRPAAAREHAPFLPVLLRDRGTLVLVAVGVCYSVVYFQAYSSLPVVMSRQGISPALYGIVVAVNGVVICLLQPLVVRAMERRRPEKVYAAGMVVFAAGYVATSGAHTAWQHGLVVVVWSLGEIAVAGVAGVLFARRAPAALKGRYMGLLSITFTLGSAVGPALGGVVLDAFGPTVLWCGCGAVALAGAGLLPLVSDPPEPVSA